MADSLAGAVLAICSTAQNSDLDQAGFEALTFIDIGNVGSIGEIGTQTNILTYDTLDTTVIQKAKGMSNAGDPAIEVARDKTDTGQDALRTAALATSDAYAFELTMANGDVIYNRGVVSGPTRPMGRNEDFDLEVFQLGLTQVEVIVEA
jgi:hypothetical protein